MDLAYLPKSAILIHSAVAALPALVVAPAQAQLDAFKLRVNAYRYGLLFIIGSAGVSIGGPFSVCGWTEAAGKAHALPGKWWNLGDIDGGAALAITSTRGIVREVSWQAPFDAIACESGAIAGGTVSVYFAPGEVLQS